MVHSAACEVKLGMPAAERRKREAVTDVRHDRMRASRPFACSATPGALQPQVAGNRELTADAIVGMIANLERVVAEKVRQGDELSTVRNDPARPARLLRLLKGQFE